MTDTPPIGAVLFVSFGGPEGLDDVLPFLRNVTAGRDVPDERLAVVAEQYNLVDGVSPINQQNRDLIEQLRQTLAGRGIDLPIYWGNRNWHPLLPATVQQMADDGIGRAVAFVTSAYSSYSGCRQYRENLAAACDAAGPGGPVVCKIRPFFNHPGFLDPIVDNVRRAIDELPDAVRGDAPVAFTAHSIPRSMAQTCDYEAQLRSVAEYVMAAVDPNRQWSLVYQSRSGPPQVPWLEPDILDHLRFQQTSGTEAVVVAPIGFVSDHMEVLYDLDTQAADLASDLGLAMTRAATPAGDPRFTDMIADLIEEQLGDTDRRAVGSLGPRSAPCAADCCPAPHRR